MLGRVGLEDASVWEDDFAKFAIYRTISYIFEYAFHCGQDAREVAGYCEDAVCEALSSKYVHMHSLFLFFAEVGV